jgi:hypothetical protein
MRDPIRAGNLPADLRETATAAFILTTGSNAERLDAAVAAVLNEDAKDAVTITEWGVRFTHPGEPPHEQQYYSKTESREARDRVLWLAPSASAVLVSRTVTTGPWEEVREDGGRER